MVSERGRYCNRDVLSFNRMRVSLPVDASLESSQMPAQLDSVLAIVYYIAVQRAEFNGYFGQHIMLTCNRMTE
jgi:hypothetical protein